MLARHSGLLAAVVLASALCLSAGAASAQGQPGATQRSRVVIQVSDAEPAKWNLALNNARNIQTDLGAANVDIEVVAYGPGIGMLKADSVVGNASTKPGRPASGRRLREHVRAQKLTLSTCCPASTTFRRRRRADAAATAGLGLHPALIDGPAARGVAASGPRTIRS
jgi:intracellular sulfur oxidation DsrE/DsrF family protein